MSEQVNEQLTQESPILEVSRIKLPNGKKYRIKDELLNGQMKILLGLNNLEDK